MIGYLKYFDDNKTMSFVVDDKELLKEYTKVWEKIKDLMGKKFDSERVYGDKYIKTKLKSYKNDLKQIFMVKVIVENYQKKVAHVSVCH